MTGFVPSGRSDGWRDIDPAHTALPAPAPEPDPQDAAAAGPVMHECECCDRRNVAAKLKGIGYVCDDCLPSYTWDYGRHPEKDHEYPEHYPVCPFSAAAGLQPVPEGTAAESVLPPRTSKAGDQMSQPDFPPRPVCSCHGWGACVHSANYTPLADGHDGERGWDWHCILRTCEGFSVTLLVRSEWVADEVTG